MTIIQVKSHPSSPAEHLRGNPINPSQSLCLGSAARSDSCIVLFVLKVPIFFADVTRGNSKCNICGASLGLGRKRRLSFRIFFLVDTGIFCLRKIVRTNFQSTCSLKQVKTVNKAFIALLNLVRYTPALSVRTRVSPTLCLLRETIFTGFHSIMFLLPQY